MHTIITQVVTDNPVVLAWGLQPNNCQQTNVCKAGFSQSILNEQYTLGTGYMEIVNNVSLSLHETSISILISNIRQTGLLHRFHWVPHHSAKASFPSSSSSSSFPPPPLSSSILALRYKSASWVNAGLDLASSQLKPPDSCRRGASASDFLDTVMIYMILIPKLD